jgi:integrase
MGVSIMQKLFKRYALKAGLDPTFSIHGELVHDEPLWTELRKGIGVNSAPCFTGFACLRHSIAVHSLETDNVDIRDVQDLLGHRAIQNTEVYAQITDKRRSHVDRLLERSAEIVSL